MMVSREFAPALRRHSARRLLAARLPAGSGGTGRRIAGRFSLSRLAARQARLLRQQGERLQVEFQAVLGPIDAEGVQALAEPLQDLPLDALVARAAALRQELGERIAAWSRQGGLLGDVHERLAPLLSVDPLLDQARSLAALKGAVR